MVNQIWLTKVKKGEFFRTILEQSPFRNLPLFYTYKKNAREVGIDFQGWKMMVVLFDDDPKQVTDFNKIAKEKGITGLSVIRVRRKGVKRAKQEIVQGNLTGEIQPSDTYLDTGLFEAAINELSARNVEAFLLEMIKTHGLIALRDSETPNLIAAIAAYRGVTEEVARNQVLSRAGFQEVGTFPTDEQKIDATIWSS